MPAGDLKAMLFGRIDGGNVDDTISQLAKTWYFIAGLQAALQIFLIWLYAGFAGNLVDPIICALGGYFLGTRKSRALAVSLFIYALAAGALTVVERGDAGGMNLILALVVVVMGWRGVHATWTYHRLNGLRTAWKHVAAISGLAAMFSVIVLAAVVLLGLWMPQYMTNDALNGLVVVAAILLPVLVVMWPLTRRHPFAQKSGDIPGVFD